MSGQVNVYNRKMSRLYSDSEIYGDYSDEENIVGVFSYRPDQVEQLDADGVPNYLVDVEVF